MHKTMSRIVVLLLVVCLALGNVVPALAADLLRKIVRSPCHNIFIIIR